VSVFSKQDLDARSETLTVVTIRTQVFWSVIQCRLLPLADHLPGDNSVTSQNTILVKIDMIHYEMTQILCHDDTGLFNVISSSCLQL
jgi:hypothetical protein